MTDTLGHSSTAEVTEETGGGGGGGGVPTQLPPPPSITQDPNPPPPTASLSDANNAATNDGADDQPRAKEAKGEPLNILVRDQTGAGLQFKVRKNTKFEKVHFLWSTQNGRNSNPGDDGILSKEELPDESSEVPV